MTPVAAVAKTKFTMLVPDMEARLDDLRSSRNVDTIVLCGIETHVCIQATCLDLLQRGFNVSYVLFATSSLSLVSL